MALVEIKMIVSRNTTAGTRSKGDKVSLPKREAESMISRGHAKATTVKKVKIKIKGNAIDETFVEDLTKKINESAKEKD